MSDESAHDELERELRQLAARMDPVPPELAAAATEAFSWRNIDAELAELVFDSLLNTDEAALVRGSPGRRLVSFQTPELTIDVEVTTVASGREVMGQITPPQPAVVEIRHRAGVVSTEANEQGCFRSASLQTGPMSLRLHPAADGPRPPIVTDWLSI
jgi:hypothetical protein